MAIEEHSHSNRLVKSLAKKTVIKYYKTEENEILPINKPDLVEPRHLITSESTATISKTSAKNFKYKLMNGMIKKFTAKFNYQQLGKKFFAWKIASHFFGEQLLMTFNNVSSKQTFSITSSIQVPNAAEGPKPISQIQQALMKAGVSDESATKNASSAAQSGRTQQMTSRRRWANPRQKTKYQSQCIKCGHFTIQNILKKHLLRAYTKMEPKFMNNATIQNYFRYWKRCTNVENQRYKQRRHKEIFNKLEARINNKKIGAFYKWIYATKKLIDGDKEQNGEDLQMQQTINTNMLHTQSVVNAQLRLNYEKQKSRVREVKQHNLLTKIMADRFQPLYQKTTQTFFNRWKTQVSYDQRYWLKCLDLAKDILVDELTQTMHINEDLNQGLSSIQKEKCPKHQGGQRTKMGGVFGDDAIEDYKEHSDPISDPLSDSLPDKNKLSKSEKSLKKPLQMFQQEQNVHQEQPHGSFIRTTSIENHTDVEEYPDATNSNTDATRTQTQFGANISKKQSQDSENVNDSGDEQAWVGHPGRLRSKGSFKQQQELDASNVMSSDDENQNQVDLPKPPPQNQAPAAASANADVGIQYIQFIYQDNIKLQQEISDITDQMIEIDNQHIQNRSTWEDEIRELQNQIQHYS